MENRGFWDASFEEMHYWRFWVVLSAAIIFILISNLWESAHHFEKADGAFIHAILSESTWINFNRELGFACFIALVLSVFVENEARKRQLTATSKQQSEISDNVFRGVYARDLPAVIVDGVVNQVLKAKIIRTDHTNNYTLDNIEGDPNHILMKVTSDYTLKNVCEFDVPVPIRLGFPLSGSGISTPNASLISVKIGAKVLDSAEISKGDMEGENPPDMIRYCWNRNVKSGELLQVVVEYELGKKRSDNEVWRSLYPGVKMELNVNVNVSGLEFDAHALSDNAANKISGRGDIGLHRWVLDGAILPHQAIGFGWRPDMTKVLADTADNDK